MAIRKIGPARTEIQEMNVIIGMEESQVIQRAFEERGHNSWSCDFKPGRLNPSRHIQGDVHEIIPRLPWVPDLIILHPVCRYLTRSGQHWIGKRGHEDRAEHVERAVEDFMRCTRYQGRVCIENPRGIMSTRWRKPDQTIQPNWFGDDASKATCLWLQNLPPLLAGWQYPPRMVNGRPRWSNQTDSGQNRVPPTKDPEDRRAERATTYSGIARAMAEQWGTL